MKFYIIILLKSWMSTPFETHTYFSIEMLWTTFAPRQILPLTQCYQKIPSDQPRFTLYNKIFLNSVII